jgi:hypothetical protein
MKTLVELKELVNNINFDNFKKEKIKKLTQKLPRVTTFEKEVSKNKNENLTIAEIKKLVEEINKKAKTVSIPSDKNKLFDDWFKQQVFQAVVFEFENKGVNDYHHWKKVFNKIQGIYGQKEIDLILGLEEFIPIFKTIKGERISSSLLETKNLNFFSIRQKISISRKNLIKPITFENLVKDPKNENKTIKELKDLVAQHNNKLKEQKEQKELTVKDVIQGALYSDFKVFGEPVALYMMKKFFFDEKILSNKKLEKFLKEVTQHNNLFAEFAKIQ